MKLVSKILGQSRSDIWKEFSVTIGANYESNGRWFSEGKIRATYRNWTIMFDTGQRPSLRYPAAYTRIHVLYISSDGFYFRLGRKKLSSALVEWLGVSRQKISPPAEDDIDTLSSAASNFDKRSDANNYRAFDADFDIKANDEAKLQLLFKDLKLRELIQSQKSVSLETSKSNEPGGQPPENVFELRLYVDNLVRDPQELDTLYSIVTRLLDALRSIDSANEERPETSL